jgi:hypothetical protein
MRLAISGNALLIGMVLDQQFGSPRRSRDLLHEWVTDEKL